MTTFGLPRCGRCASRRHERGFCDGRSACLRRLLGDHFGGRFIEPQPLVGGLTHKAVRCPAGKFDLGDEHRLQPID